MQLGSYLLLLFCFFCFTFVGFVIFVCLFVCLFCISGKKEEVSTDIACIVSIGCGVFPAEPIGNADIIDAISPLKLSKLPTRIKQTINMLTTAVSVAIG